MLQTTEGENKVEPAGKQAMISTGRRHSHVARLLTALQGPAGRHGKTFGRLAAKSESQQKANRFARETLEIQLQTQLEVHRKLSVIELCVLASFPWHRRTSISTSDTSTRSPPPPFPNLCLALIGILHHCAFTNLSHSSGHSGRFGHEFLGMFLTHLGFQFGLTWWAEFDIESQGDGRSALLRYANNSNYRNDSMIRKEGELGSFLRTYFF